MVTVTWLCLDANYTSGDQVGHLHCRLLWYTFIIDVRLFVIEFLIGISFYPFICFCCRVLLVVFSLSSLLSFKDTAV